MLLLASLARLSASVLAGDHRTAIPTLGAPPMMRCSRADCMKLLVSAAMHASPLLTLPSRASASAIQADDKSFDFVLPDGTWRTSGLRRGEPPQLFLQTAQRVDGQARLEVAVSFATGSDWGLKFQPKKLSDLGSVEVVGARLQAQDASSAKLLRAEKTSGGGLFAVTCYEYRFELAQGGRQAVKLALQQGRLYRLTITCEPTAPDALLSEVDGIVGSFRAFPLNAGCLSQSNRGEKALPGVCY